MGLYEFETSLICRASSSIARAAQRNPISKVLGKKVPSHCSEVGGSEAHASPLVSLSL